MIVESSDEIVDTITEKIIKLIIDHKSAKIRFEGNNRYDDKELSDYDIDKIEKTYKLYLKLIEKNLLEKELAR